MTLTILIVAWPCVRSYSNGKFVAGIAGQHLHFLSGLAKMSKDTHPNGRTMEEWTNIKMRKPGSPLISNILTWNQFSILVRREAADSALQALAVHQVSIQILNSMCVCLSALHNLPCVSFQAFVLCTVRGSAGILWASSMVNVGPSVSHNKSMDTKVKLDDGAKKAEEGSFTYLKIQLAVHHCNRPYWILPCINHNHVFWVHDAGHTCTNAVLCHGVGTEGMMKYYSSSRLEFSIKVYLTCSYVATGTTGAYFWKHQEYHNIKYLNWCESNVWELDLPYSEYCGQQSQKWRSSPLGQITHVRITLL